MFPQMSADCKKSCKEEGHNFRFKVKIYYSSIVSRSRFTTHLEPTHLAVYTELPHNNFLKPGSVMDKVALELLNI